MNDRFKFRIYDLEQKHYLRVIQDETTGAEGFAAFYGEYNNICKPMSFFLCHNIDRWVIEQCTGLSDKNGNLIYEGDIVKSMIRTGYIKWHKGDMTWYIYVLKSNEIIALNSYLDGELEIIGNIHEQAEQNDTEAD